MKILLVFLVCSALISYFIYRSEATPVPPSVTKTVAEKPAPVARSDGQPAADPIFYLVADDGSFVEVGPTAYARTRVGDGYASREWRRGTA